MIALTTSVLTCRRHKRAYMGLIIYRPLQGLSTSLLPNLIRRFKPLITSMIALTTSVLTCRRHKRAYMGLIIYRRLQGLSTSLLPNLIPSLLIGIIGTTRKASIS